MSNRWIGLAVVLTGCPWLESVVDPGPTMQETTSVTEEATVVAAVLEEVVLPTEVSLPTGFLETTVFYEADLQANTVTRGVRRTASPTRASDLGEGLSMTVFDAAGVVLLQGSTPNPLQETTCEEDLQGPCDGVEMGFEPTVVLRLPEDVAARAVLWSVEVRSGPLVGQGFAFPLER